MIDLLKISSVEPCSLKNNHNQLFLTLMENLKYQDSLNKIADKMKMRFTTKVKHTHKGEDDHTSDVSDAEEDY
jgi:hypothetical protein